MSRPAGQACTCAETVARVPACVCLCAHTCRRARGRCGGDAAPGRAGPGVGPQTWRDVALCPAPAVFLLDGPVRVSRSTMDSFARSANIYGTAALFPSVGFSFLWPCAQPPPPPALGSLPVQEKSHVTDVAPSWEDWLADLPSPLRVLVSGGGYLRDSPVSLPLPALPGSWLLPAGRGGAVVPCRAPEPVTPAPGPGGSPERAGLR